MRSSGCSKATNETAARYGYRELAVTGAHAVAVDLLPAVHKDPFDRMLVTQAQIEGMILLTSDALVAGYPGPIELV